MEALDDGLGLQRLGEIVGDPELQDAADLRLLLDGGEDHDGHLAQRVVGADRFERLQAVHHRHHQVEQDEIEGLALQDLEGLGAMDRLRDRPAELAPDDMAEQHP